MTSATTLAVPASMPGAREQRRQAVREAHGRERRGEEADEREAELRDGEEPARVVEQAPHPAGARLPLLDQLLDAAAADRDERDLGGDEEALEDREDDQEQDRGDRVVHVAPPSAAGAWVGASAVPGFAVARVAGGRRISRRDAARGSAPGRPPRACPAGRRA